MDCLNTIESSYRLELRDLFDAHFGRFEAKIEQRLAAVQVEIESRFERRFATQDGRFGSLDVKIEQLRVEMHRGLLATEVAARPMSLK